MKDKLYRYLFETHNVRGELVQLPNTYQEIISQYHYPPAIKQLIAETLVATSLLTATLKFEGNISIQLESEGPLKLLVVNGNHEQQLRALALFDEIENSQTNLSALARNATLTVTLTPKQGRAYQGIITITNESIPASIENYFLQSEQLETRLWIFSDDENTAGIMLQKMPATKKDSESFEHLKILTNTITAAELFSLTPDDILKRLYHEEDIRVFEPLYPEFKCQCSREKTASAIVAIGKSEANTLLKEDTTITIHCDYCKEDYVFNEEDVNALFEEAAKAQQG